MGLSVVNPGQVMDFDWPSYHVLLQKDDMLDDLDKL